MFDAIDVRQLGARGDAQTDDTKALQAAIDLAAETGRAVFLQPGMYRCGTLYLRPEVVLYAEPTWSYRRNASGKTVIVQADKQMVCQIDLTNAQGCTLRGLSLMGLGTGTCVGMLSRKTNYGEQEDAYRIETCCVSNYGGHAVFLDHVWCFSVRHCQFGSCGGDGLRVNGWDGFVLDNWFSGNCGAGYYGERPNCSITMTGNRIEWNAAGGIVVHHGSHYNLTGNYIDRSGRAGIELHNCNTIACSGNIVYRSGKYQAADPASAHCIIDHCCGVSFTGNVFKHGMDDGAKGVLTPNWAMRVQCLTDCVVNNNTMYKGAVSGLIDDHGGHENLIMCQNTGCASDQL